MKHVLREQYGIIPTRIDAQIGGWSALAYKVTAPERDYFLKVYEKSNVSTAFWTANLGAYMPILMWLGETALAGRVPKPLRAANGGYMVEDERNIYVLFDFIDGATVGGSPLSAMEVQSLADIIAQLHQSGYPFPLASITEDFATPFCGALKACLSGSGKKELDALLLPHREALMRKIETTQALALAAKNECADMVLCHTDAHGYNLMRGGSLTLIDWEGLKLAPAEADLFMFSHKPFWPAFLARYRQQRPGFALNELMLRFYQNRRKVEDLWASAERVLLGQLPPEEIAPDLSLIANECAHMDELLC